MSSWAVITGASAGIGEAFARRLHADGWRLMLAARRIDRLESLARELGGDVRCVAADLSLGADRDKLWTIVETLDAPVELLVNNAGFGLQGAFAELDRERQLQMIQVNVTALADLARRFLALRGATGGGALINIASVVGLRPVPHLAVYSATKHFVVAFSVALAEEVRAAGTRVLAVCPGPVPTEFQEVAGSRLDRASRLVAISASQVVDESLAALERGDRLWVTGGAMRWAARLAQLLPLPTAARLAARRPR